MEHTVYTGQTLRILIRVLDSNGDPVDLSGAIAYDCRIRFPAAKVSFPVTFDPTESILTLNVDRDITGTWIPGTYDFQFWVDFGENPSSLEEDMLYSDKLVVKGGY